MTPTETILWVFDEMRYGAALLDDLGSVKALNVCAKRILANHANGNGCRHSADPRSTSKVLRRLFGKEFPQSGNRVFIANGTKSSVRPIVACKMMLSRSSERAPHLILLFIDLDERPYHRTVVLREAFSLTEAEARLAARLALGDSLQQIAVDHGVAIDTTRAQLKSVLAKTHTHRQAELVALVNRLLALPR